jgi:deoxyhypusine synthase
MWILGRTYDGDTRSLFKWGRRRRIPCFAPLLSDQNVLLSLFYDLDVTVARVLGLDPDFQRVLGMSHCKRLKCW